MSTGRIIEGKANMLELGEGNVEKLQNDGPTSHLEALQEPFKQKPIRTHVEGEEGLETHSEASDGHFNAGVEPKSRLGRKTILLAVGALLLVGLGWWFLRACNVGDTEVAGLTTDLALKVPIDSDEVVVPSNIEGKKLIALTFDDGPSKATTGRLLEILKDKNVRATFFVVGNLVKNAPELLKQEVAAGHEVGSHTMGHANLSRTSAAGIRKETETMRGLYKEVTGREMRIMRPPYGAMNVTVQQNIGMPMIIWTVDTEDWKYRDAAAVRRNAVNAAFDGAIILMHDIHATTVDAVAGIIDDLRAQGYEFLTVSQLAAARGVKMKNGEAYGGFRP